jgi:hypothetical protein
MISVGRSLVFWIGLVGSSGPAFSQTFTPGTYESQDSDGLTSNIAVSNLSSGEQQLSEDTNALLHLGSCQVDIKDLRVVPNGYNQSDFLSGQFVSCAFTNCPGIPACTQSNVTLSPGRYSKQGLDKICAVWQNGVSRCFTMIGVIRNIPVNGATVHTDTR